MKKFLLISLIIIFSNLNQSCDSKSDNFFLDKNGVTCRCPNSKVGDVGEINGVEYESVDDKLLRKRRDEKVDMSKLCTSLVTNMKRLFYGDGGQGETWRQNFNQPIGNWDVSNVTNMSDMFYRSQFNQPIDYWDVSNVTDMSNMFFNSRFNQPINNWNVSNVTSMSGMFSCGYFNQPIGNWNVSNVTSMSGMFSGCYYNLLSSFNQTIENWDVSNVTSMSGMFMWSQFNQPIGNWKVSKVLDFENMFQGSDFNQPIDQWNVNGGKDEYGIRRFKGMFIGSKFRQDISSWNLHLQLSEIEQMNGGLGILGLDNDYYYDYLYLHE